MSADLQLYSGYTEADLGILHRFRSDSAVPEPGFIVDFIGVRTRASAVYPAARTLQNTVLGLPVPTDFHAETIEWVGALKSVAAARDRFAVMELGAAYGTWCVGSAVAARSLGIEDIRIYAVEGDPQHVVALQNHCRDNGFDPARHTLLQAAVGAASGVAQWPKMEDSSGVLGSRPVTDGSAGPIGAEMIDVPVIAMADLVGCEPVWDLVHIDVQGSEFEICQSCLGLLNERVKWIVVGTHSRKLDGDMLDMMFRAGWMLENEKPTRFAFMPGVPTLEAMAQFDGTQVWRNPRLG